MSRSQAFVLNLVISLLILLVILYLSWNRWYTPALFMADGGWQGFRLVAVIFLLVGPGLTLLLFKPGKRGLWYDMVIVILLQIGVLVWGSWTLYRERPVALVYSEGYFIPVTGYQLKDAGLTAEKLESLDRARPALIYLDLPEDEETMQQYRLRVMATGVPLYLLLELYRPFDTSALEKVRRQDLDMEKRYAGKPAQYRIYQRFLQEHEQGTDALIYVPLHARYIRQILALDASTGKVISSLQIIPPPLMTVRPPPRKNEV